MKPSSRPAVKKVVEMLEGETASLPLPPNPVLFPEETPSQNPDEIWSSSMLSDYNKTSSLIVNSCGIKKS